MSSYKKLKIDPKGKIGTKLLFEDSNTRVWLLELQPGEATEWHQHECDYRFVVTSTGTVRTEYVNGDIEKQEGDKLGSTQFREKDMAHRLVNYGKSVYQNIVIEFKQH